MITQASLVFPHHLFPESPALHPGRPIILVEDPLVLGDPEVGFEFHAKKLLYHLATMRAFEERLRADGYQVLRVAWEPGLRTDELLARAFPGLRAAHLCEPDDFLLEKRLRRWADRQGVELIFHPSPLFLTPRDWTDRFFASKKRVIMADFYTAQRRRLGILVDDHGQPTGGRWSFDEENRKRLPAGHRVPVDPIANDHPSWMPEEIRRVREKFPHAFGTAEGMPWPITPSGALRWLDDFLDQRLGQFGDYEDAIHTRERVLFHGQLTPMMNAGLLPPALVVERTLAVARERSIPLNALEGFIRQIIGWREFIRAQYHRNGTAMRTRNFWGFDRPMPRAFYTGETGIQPLDLAIRRTLDHGWCHHIERLMVLGAMFLLCRIHPDAVYRWFMELFADAYDWVMVPNVYAMSQFADGGTFTTKPYLCGSNYILKMSDWKKGPWCPAWDGLYWSFIADYADVFAANPRMGMMARVVSSMDPAKLDAHRKNADEFFAGLM